MESVLTLRKSIPRKPSVLAVDGGRLLATSDYFEEQAPWYLPAAFENPSNLVNHSNPWSSERASGSVTRGEWLVAMLRLRTQRYLE